MNTYAMYAFINYVKGPLCAIWIWLCQGIIDCKGFIKKS